MEPETAMGMSSIDISLISAGVSFLSFLVTSFFAWRTKFSPPKLVGSFPYSVIWRFETNNEKNPEDIYIIPFIWFSNIGAKPFLVGDVRLSICSNEGAEFHLSPIHSVPLEAVEKPNTYTDNELIRLGEAPFGGFSIAKDTQWKNTIAFPISAKEKKLLKGSVKLVFEMCKLGSEQFVPVISQDINFNNSSFSWLEWAGRSGTEYYYKVK